MTRLALILICALATWQPLYSRGELRGYVEDRGHGYFVIYSRRCEKLGWMGRAGLRNAAGVLVWERGDD